MTTVEILLLVVGLVAAFIAYQAHKAGVSFSVQASTDLSTAKADITTDVHAIELKVTALEAKIETALKPSAPTVAAPAVTALAP